MQVVYTGEYDAVRISATGQTATRDEPVDVDDEVAASLLEQVDCWRAADDDVPAAEHYSGVPAAGAPD